MTAYTEDDDLEPSLLERYCSGTTSPDEATRIETWFRRHPDRRGWYETLKRGLKKGDFPQLSERELDKALAAFVKAALDRHPAAGGHAAREAIESHSRGAQRKGSSKGHTLRRSLWSLALGLVSAVVLIVVGWSAGVHHLARGAARAALIYTTGKGERATITLPDGNTAALNVASRLEVPADYAAGHHAVRLVGEAMFDVRHHAGTSFAVVVGSDTAHVLGTRFVVRRYATDTATTVVVHDGKVAVHAMVVTAARQLVIGPTGNTLRPADPGQFSFATGVLTLDRVPLSAAIAELDRWYDVDIQLQDPALATRRVVGEYAAGSLADLADILAGTCDVRVVRHGRVLTLFPK